MKLLKTFDLVVQVILFSMILLFFIFFIVESDLADSFFVYSYFYLGGWQLLSFIIHFFSDTGILLTKPRKFYFFCLLFMIAFGIIAWVNWNRNGNSLMVYLLTLVIVSPIMAFHYMSICYREIKLISNRSMATLK